MCIAASESVLGQAFFRSINGSALSSILPLSQTLLVQVVPNPGLHGRAFGCKSVPNALLCCRMHRNACVHVYFTPVLVVLFLVSTWRTLSNIQAPNFFLNLSNGTGREACEYSRFGLRHLV